MKNNHNRIKRKNISKIKENRNSNIQENKIEEIKIKVKPRKDIKKILLPMRKENLGSYQKKRLLNNNNQNIASPNNTTTTGNNNDVSRKLIFLNEKKNPINGDKIGFYINTERNDIKCFNQKKKLLKISTNDEIFKNYKRRIDKNILRPNKKNYMNNYNDSLIKTFSFKKDNSLNNNPKSFELIEKFAENFKNKERSESLKNVLNMYKRYKSLSSLTNRNKLNNSFSSIAIVKNKSYYQKGENNFLNIIKRKEKENKEKIVDNINQIPTSRNDINNYNCNFPSKENINLLNTEKEKNSNSKSKNDKKFFLRKVIREEKCYIDKNGKIHVVDFKQSLIDDKSNKFNTKKNSKKNKTQRSYKNRKNKKINVEINQINNINSYNNIGDIHSIKDLKKYKKNENILESNKYQNLTERNGTDNLRIIGLSKKSSKNKSNYKYYENKLTNISKKIDKDIPNNNSSFNRITHRAVHSFGKNYSIYYSYNNNSETNNDKNIDTNIDNIKMQNQNFCGYNNINDYTYKNHYDPYTDRGIFAQNNDNCSFYESKSFSNYKEKILRQNNGNVKIFGNNIFDINYQNNPDNNLYVEDLNNKTFFNSYILDYSFNNYNSRKNSGKISSYRLIRIPKYNN